MMFSTVFTLHPKYAHSNPLNDYTLAPTEVGGRRHTFQLLLLHGVAMENRAMSPYLCNDLPTPFRRAQTIVLLHPLGSHSQSGWNKLSLKYEHCASVEGAEFGGHGRESPALVSHWANTSSSLTAYQAWGLDLNSIPDLPFSHGQSSLKGPIKALSWWPQS